MNFTLLFEELWKQYADKTPSAHKVKLLLEGKGEEIFNDHIAIRTFDDPRTNIEVLAKPFIALGYKEMGDYHFEAKKLYAKHYECLDRPDAPKIFISQLLTEHFSDQLQTTVKQILDSCNPDTFLNDDLILKGRVWQTPSYGTYQRLQQESEYAAWMYVNGFCSNHFTVDVNKLEGFENLAVLNEFLKANGFVLNASGGEIKGTPSQLLEQSSILADKIEMEFKEGMKEVTSCYYEFAYRYTKQNGKLFTGFIANSADKIFESTDMKLQEA